MAGGDVAAERAARSPSEPLVDAQPVKGVLAAGQPTELVAVRVLCQAHRARRVRVSVVGRLVTVGRRFGTSHLAFAPSHGRRRRVHRGRVCGQDGLVDPYGGTAVADLDVVHDAPL